MVEADVVSTPNGDYVYRTQDLNDDGDAEDAGDATLWLDLKALNPAASAFEVSFDGDAAYVTDTDGADSNIIYRAEDIDGDGTVSAGEVTRFIDGDNAFGVPVDFAMDARGGSVFLREFLDTAGPMSVFELTDLDGSGLIDAAGENRGGLEQHLPARRVRGVRGLFAGGARRRVAVVHVERRGRG